MFASGEKQPWAEPPPSSSESDNTSIRTTQETYKGMKIKVEKIKHKYLKILDYTITIK